MKISYIIPCYNSSKTIKRAIDSILAQKENKYGIEYEIVVVDDGSEDNLQSVVDTYEDDALKKIKLFQKENGGVASARNYGVKHATGDYIIFVDSDDYVSEKLIDDIARFINKGYDLIKWSATIVDENGKKVQENERFENEQLTGEDGFNKLFGTDPWLDCLWNYAIKKDVMLEFPEGTYHEDFAVMPLIMLNCKTMMILDKFEYFYVQTESSIMRGNDRKKQRKKLEDILHHFDTLTETANKLDISDYTKENVGIFATNSLLVIINDLDGENKSFFINELKKRKISKYIKARNAKQLAKKILLTIKY